ncbi:hypothetical protein KC727_00225 [Candidatus Kaiserbacteria bacterium]|nr:hypothetical protein [Candidatus Kaiserbacteria bacterium]
MLNLFPIQFLSLIAYAILRIIVGALLVRIGYTHIVRRVDLLPLRGFSFGRYSTMLVLLFGYLEVVIGTLFVVGLYTQAAALAGIVLSLYMLIRYTRFPSPHIPDRTFYILLLAASLSLFITGAGIFAFDLPI